MAVKQFTLSSCEKIAAKAWVDLSTQANLMRDDISNDILARLGLPQGTKLNIVDLDKGLIMVEVPEPKEKIGPKLVKDIESEAPEEEIADPAKPE